VRFGSSIVDPHGSEASRIAGVWWLIFGLAALVYIVVAVLIVFALVRGRRRNAKSSSLREDAFIWVGGIAVPVLILFVVAVVTVHTTAALRNPSPRALHVTVTGHDWWWDVQYPGTAGRTANEIHIPVDRPVELRLLSTDVIHSFWVPQLMGKHDMTPGKTVTTWLQADQPGTYWGECAEFCGIQHAKMALLVVAEPASEFQAWLERERSPALQASDPLAQRGAQVFAREGCIQCHAVRYGRGAIGGEIGPDLTHLASRQTLAAGILPNTRDNLATWVTNPQSIKPGNNMPPTNLDSDSLLALLAYLESLK
jgi:cytochrome c oxidase subunit 2